MNQWSKKENVLEANLVPKFISRRSDDVKRRQWNEPGYEVDWVFNLATGTHILI